MRERIGGLLASAEWWSEKILDSQRVIARVLVVTGICLAAALVVSQVARADNAYSYASQKEKKAIRVIANFYGYDYDDVKASCSGNNCHWVLDFVPRTDIICTYEGYLKMTRYQNRIYNVSKGCMG